MIAHKVLFLGLISLLLLLCGGCSRDKPGAGKISRTSSWPMDRADAGNTGYVEVSGPLKPYLLWKSRPFSQSNVFNTISPVLGNDGNLYCSHGNGVTAIDTNGKLLWTVELRPVSGEFSPAVDKSGIIYAATRDFFSDFPASEFVPGRFYGLSADGRRLWADASGWRPRSAPLVDYQSRAYALAERGERGLGQLESEYRLIVLDSKGQVLRTIKLPNYTQTRVLALRIGDQGTQAFCAAANKIIRIDPSSTTLSATIGTYKPFGPNVTGISVSRSGDAIYACLDNGLVVRINPDNMRVVWTASLGAKSTYYGPAIHPLFGIYLSDRSGRLAHITHEGKTSWMAKLPIEIFSPPAVDKNGNIYVTGDGWLFRVSATGKTEWKLKVGSRAGDAVSGAILGSDGTIYCYSESACAVVDASARPLQRTGRFVGE